MSTLSNKEPQVTIVIPNYNGITFISDCLDSLRNNCNIKHKIIMIDNASTDGSLELVQEHYSEVTCISLKENTGFCGAVNAGIKATDTPYVLLLNNDTQIAKGFVENLLDTILKNEAYFSVAAKMLQLKQKERIDDAGDFYCALGWSFARGKDKPATLYNKPGTIFSSCAGAAIYRREVFEEIGYFDEAHFAYLEDLDIGYRAKIYGYKNYYQPKSIVYHAGSGTSGSRYNQFKISHSARNNIYVVYKNMPPLQLILNLPFIFWGILIKTVFFGKRGYGKEYLTGIKNGLILSAKNRKQKIKFRIEKLPNYFWIQIELWINTLRKLLNFR